MKILFIIESLGGGGKERRLFSLIKELERKGFDQDILLLKENVHYKEIHDLDVNIHFLKRSIKEDIRILSKFSKLLKKINPDIVHGWDNLSAFHFAPICKLNGIPFINSMITRAVPKLSKFSLHYWVYALSYPFSDVILSNSRAGLVSFSAPLKKSRVIYNGFDLSRVNVKQQPKEVLKMLDIVDKKVVGMVANFTIKKDYNTFVRAGKIVLKNYKNVVFIMIGDGPKLNEIRDSIAPALSNSFLFLGRQQDVESIVNIFDIGVLVSFTEGISNAIMEYMVFEKPVIASNTGGTPELVVDNETGYLIENKKPQLLAEKIMYLLNNNTEAKKMGKAGRKRIETEFTIDRMVSEFVQLYKDTLSKK